MTLWAFEGRWELSRQIDDRASKRVGRFEGVAVFQRDNSGLSYAEAGELSFEGMAPLQAEQRYHWAADGRDIHVSFADGRAFHTFSLGPKAEATHDCPPDWYAVSYDFEAWPTWTSTWTVTGPRKDYTMVSTYTRAPRAH